ncbi:MAG: Ferredoxin reductase [Burkholderiaceae bacterium]|jgi:NTE family protein|nr:MAG: Ferredoxin reductase [Burkholderiaceae bacterium]
MAADTRCMNLALQGGGSHGAFTWGVLDALLEDGRVRFEGLSGTSAGAMNAAALAHGLARGADRPGSDPRELARTALANLWNGVVSMGSVSSTITQAQRAPFDLLFGGLNALSRMGWLRGFGGLAGLDSPAQIWGHALGSVWTSAVSPYQSNPFDINPLLNFLQSQIDFERLAAPGATKVFVVATCVQTGKAEVFSGKKLSARAVMASACLPMVFHAVEIDGMHYWDGGYAGNPAIHPLIYQCDCRDVVLVQINPIKRDKIPVTAAEIMDRTNEITFNGALIAEMRAIDFVKRLLAERRLDPARYKDMLMHRIDGGESLEKYHASSKSAIDGPLIYALRDLGASCAKKWLAENFDAIGARDTVDIARDYLDALRLPVRGRKQPGATRDT